MPRAASMPEFEVVAANSDPYFALPSLRGAPAYSRPPRAVMDSARPLDPDDLPLAVELTDEERAVLFQLDPARLSPSLSAGARRATALESIPGDPGGSVDSAATRASSGRDGLHPATSGGTPAIAPRWLSLRSLAQRLGARGR